MSLTSHVAVSNVLCTLRRCQSSSGSKGSPVHYLRSDHVGPSFNYCTGRGCVVLYVSIASKDPITIHDKKAKLLDPVCRKIRYEIDMNSIAGFIIHDLASRAQAAIHEFLEIAGHAFPVNQRSLQEKERSTFIITTMDLSWCMATILFLAASSIRRITNDGGWSIERTTGEIFQDSSWTIGIHGFMRKDVGWAVLIHAYTRMVGEVQC
ncbi:uncharacterized protein [Triticum aestivum]|uniref:uncharacterized protein n=1 Tax=Triticum aestivum TaxID=4565 RepID=UPI001D010232|nr:uncharacterized protein LOC123168464 [Triticum aestivum]